MNPKLFFTASTTALLFFALPHSRSAAGQTANLPEPNPWVASSVYPMSHYNPAQTDTTSVAGPTVGRELTASEVKAVTAA